MNEVKIVGSRLKIARRYRALSQKELSDSIGVSQGNLSHIESNRHNPSQEVMDKLTKALKVAPEWLTGESADGGVPLDSQPNIKESERDAIGSRFLIAYNRLRKLGIINSDAEFASFGNIPRSSLSLALAGKAPVQLEWIPFLEEKGANREFVYNNHVPVIKLNMSRRISDTEDISRNIMALVESIDEDMKLLKEYLSQVI